MAYFLTDCSNYLFNIITCKWNMFSVQKRASCSSGGIQCRPSLGWWSSSFVSEPQVLSSLSTDIEQIDHSFSCICPVIDHEFSHNKVARDSGGDSGVDALTTLTMLWWNYLSVVGQVHEKLSSTDFLG